MLLKIDDVPSKRPGRWKTTRVYTLKCDECGIKFTRKYVSKMSQTSKKKMHFCSHKCKCASQKNGELARRMQDTCIERYGVRNAFQGEEQKKKIRRTNIERYGTEHAMQSDDVKRRREQTCIDKFGVTAPMQSHEIQQKSRETCQNRYGGPNCMNSSDVKKRISATMLKRYGYEHAFQLPSTRKNCSSASSFMKRHATMKRNNTFRKSKVENAVGKALVERFGANDVKSQVKPRKDKRWLIDFYVISIDAYISVDGVYWHGLDRPIHVIEQKKTKHDTAIYKKWCIDKEQDAWFKTQQSRFVRVYDNELKTMEAISRFVEAL